MSQPEITQRKLRKVSEMKLKFPSSERNVRRNLGFILIGLNTFTCTPRSPNRRAQNDHFSTLRRHFCTKNQANLSKNSRKNKILYLKKHDLDFNVILN